MLFVRVFVFAFLYMYRYIHVVRSGLDMAHSENQNQLALWGQHFLGSARAGGSSDNLGAWGGMAGPGASLRYWCAVHKRVARLGAVLGPQRFCLLNFDALCDRPREVLAAARTNRARAFQFGAFTLKFF